MGLVFPRQRPLGDFQGPAHILPVRVELCPDWSAHPHSRLDEDVSFEFTYNLHPTVNMTNVV